LQVKLLKLQVLRELQCLWKGWYLCNRLYGWIFPFLYARAVLPHCVDDKIREACFKTGLHIGS